MSRRPVPLRRIGLLFAVCLGLGMSAVVAAILILHARDATRAEVNTSFDLASAFLEEFRGRFQVGQQPMEEALALARQIDLMRHVRVEVRGVDGHLMSPRGPDPRDGEPGPPGWFTRLLAERPRIASAPITSYPHQLGTLMLTTDYRDEAREAWMDFRAIMAVILCLAAVAAVTTFVVLHLIHRRLRAFDRVLRAIREGDFTAAPPPQRLSEFDDLATGIRALAADLGAREEENRLLQRRLMTLSDSERRQLASDLHDGLGPVLFALRTAASEARAILSRGEAGKGEAGKGELGIELDAISAHAEALQGMVRGVIYHLRPMIEPNASLFDLLAEFAAGFAEVAPEVTVRLDLGDDTRIACGESAGLAILRFAQESALNAVRHGGADEITVAARTSLGAGRAPWVHVELADNGRGPAPEAAPSYGQAGILDRARALGGEYQRPARRDGWVRTTLSLPLRGKTLETMSAA